MSDETTVVSTSRPHMPEGYLPGEGKGTLLPWEFAQERLEAARNYWVATVRPDGRPHAVPVWGVWLDSKFYFDGSPQTRRGRNLAQNPAAAIHLESGDEVVIVEGEARQFLSPPRSLTTRLAEAYTSKYEGYTATPDQWDQGGLYELSPRLALGWDKFPDHCTRWRFEES